MFFCLQTCKYSPDVLLVFTFLADSSPGYVPLPAKSALKAPESSQTLRELNVDNSSDERPRSASPPPRSIDTPPAASSPTQQQTAPSYQLSASGGAAAKVIQAPSNGVQQCLQRAKAAASTGQLARPAASVAAEPLPPALPPKTRKTKGSEAPKVSENSDRGDSDMDEETFSSSSQDKLRVKKVRHSNATNSCVSERFCVLEDKRKRVVPPQTSFTRYFFTTFDVTNCLS